MKWAGTRSFDGKGEEEEDGTKSHTFTVDEVRSNLYCSQNRKDIDAEYVVEDESL